MGLLHLQRGADYPGIRKSRIDEYADHGCLGQQLMQQPKPFCRKVRLKKIHACNRAARSIETSNEANPDRIATDREDNRNGRGCCLRGQR